MNYCEVIRPDNTAATGTLTADDAAVTDGAVGSHVNGANS